ncbi:serine hydrolase [Pandoraea iniqua]|uniref:serine hydrolase n=1 Tax=Pandoraea iniqua TaxID=2508288 RepID=UPI0012415DD5|nr:serine hydrolase [Pandoraea iniqua]
MQTLACLGWGSLIWDAGKFTVRKGWFDDGPFVPVEFLRQSKDGRITLVVNSGGLAVPVLWALMEAKNIEDACHALGEREGIPEKNRSAHVGTWQRHDHAPPEAIPSLDQWARSRGIDGVVWTALPPKMEGRPNGYRATADEVVAYLAGLQGRPRILAEQYVRKAPRQIDTLFRRRIEAELHWSPCQN